MIAPLLFLTGLGDTTAVNASLILNIEVLFIILFGYLIFRETLQLKDVLGILLIITGGVYLLTEGEFTDIVRNVAVTGNFLVMAAASSGALIQS